jgi:hypothetical protein
VVRKRRKREGGAERSTAYVVTTGWHSETFIVLQAPKQRLLVLLLQIGWQ